MKHKDFDDLLEKTIATIKELSNLKGGEYAGDHDRLANFKRNAEHLGLHPLSVWAVYVGKHIDAINQYVNDKQNKKQRDRLETIEGRFDDAILYLILGKAIVIEDKEKNAIIDKPLDLSPFIRQNLTMPSITLNRWYYRVKSEQTWHDWPTTVVSPTINGDTIICDDKILDPHVASVMVKSSQIGAPVRIWDKILTTAVLPGSGDLTGIEQWQLHNAPAR